MRASVVTQADLEALNDVLERMRATDDELRALESLCREKGDTQRVQSCYVARLRLGEARAMVEHAFR